MDLEELCCNICQETFGNKREPRMLPCGHTYCYMCLSDLLSRGPLTCPEDRSSINVSTADELPKNFALMKLMGKTHPEPDSSVCATHKKALEYVCMEDQVKVCAKCALFGGHKGHDIRPIEDIMSEIAMKADCLIDMLQIIEISQDNVMDETVKVRLDKLYEKYRARKQTLESELREGFAKLKAKISQVEKETLSSLQKNFDYIEGNIVNVRDIPKLIDSQATMWKEKVRKKLDKVAKQTEDPNYFTLDILDTANGDLFQLGEKLLIDLEALKDLQIGPLENLVESLGVSFNEESLYEACKINTLPKITQLTQVEEIRSSITTEESQETPDKPQFNEEVFNQALDVLKFHTTDVADFSGAGDLTEHAKKIAPYLVGNSYLKSLKLVKNNLTDQDACEIFKALQENFTLQSLHMSQNTLGTEALDELIEMLNINTTLRDVYLTGNPKIPYDYKTKFASMSNKFRKIHT